MLYVYLDETTFGELSNESGYGCLISQERIDYSIIQKALSDLEKDADRFNPKFKKQDERTLNRGYFHAADDSKNAHSHLCNAINKGVTGNFKTHIINTKRTLIDIESAYDISSKLNILEAFWISKEITFIFEERMRLTPNRLKKWWNSLWEEMIYTACSSPYYVTYYPKFNFEICDKTEPGLQVVDFLLWASSRQFTKKSCPWLKRVKSLVQTNFASENKSWRGHSIDVNFGCRPSFSYTYEDYSCNHFDDVSKAIMVENYIKHVYQVLKFLTNNKNKFVSHFEEDIFISYNNVSIQVS